MPLHPLQMAEKHLFKGIAAIEPHQVGNAQQPLVVLGQELCLLVIQHLDTVFDAPQENVGGMQFVPGILLDPGRLQQAFQHVERAAATQVRIAATSDELLGLDEELDLADPSPAQFHIVPGDRNLAVALVHVDLALDRLDVGDGRKVQILAPDEGDDLVQEGLAGRDVAGTGARLDQRGPFPVLTERLVIGQCGRHGHGERRGARIRTQAQVGAEDIALGGPLLHDLHKPARHAHEFDRRFRGRGDWRHRRIVEHDQVDVRGVIELHRAMLAHGENDETAVRFRIVRVSRLEFPLGSQIVEAKTGGG